MAAIGVAVGFGGSAGAADAAKLSRDAGVGVLPGLSRGVGVGGVAELAKDTYAESLFLIRETDQLTAQEKALILGGSAQHLLPLGS